MTTGCRCFSIARLRRCTPAATSLRIALAALVIAVWSGSASASLVTWVPITSGPEGVTADLKVGNAVVGTVTITRENLNNWTDSLAWTAYPGEGLQLMEQAADYTGNPNATPSHSASYKVTLTSVAEGWTFTGFGLSQYAPSQPQTPNDNAPWVANPEYELTFDDSEGAQMTVTEGDINYFLNADDGEAFGSGETLETNGSLSNHPRNQIKRDKADQWSIAFDPSITEYTLVYTTPAETPPGYEPLFFTATAVPEPASLLMGGIAAAGFGVTLRRRRRSAAATS